MTTRPAGASTLSYELAKKIRELLKSRRWSQRYLAQQLGVTQGTVSYLLGQKRRAAVLDYYERLAQVFGLSLSALIHDLEDRRALSEGVTADVLALENTPTPPPVVDPAPPTPPGPGAYYLDANVLRLFAEAFHHARAADTETQIDERIRHALAEWDARRRHEPEDEPDRKTRKKKAGRGTAPERPYRTGTARPAGDADRTAPGALSARRDPAAAGAGGRRG